MNSEWVSCRLRDVLESIDERAADQEISLVLSVTEKRGIIPQDQVFKKRIATADVGKYKVLRPMDIAYNPYLLWTGAIGQWMGKQAGVTSPVYECFRARANTNPRFLGLLFESGILTPYFDNTAIGSIQRRRRTTPKVFLDAEIQIPPLPVQRRIVDLMTHLDGHLANLCKELEILGRALMTRRNALPTSAEVAIAAITVGVDSGKSLVTGGDQPEPGLPRILKLSAVRPGLYDGTQAKSLPRDVALPDSAIVREGDVLVTRSNTPDRVGYCARARQVEHRTYMPDLVWRVRLDESRCLPDYFEQAMASEEMRRRVTQTASGTSSSMVKINKKGFSTVKIPLPDLNEQIDYVAECKALAEVQVALTSEIGTLHTIRTQVLELLLTDGDIVAEEYDSLFEGVD